MYVGVGYVLLLFGGGLACLCPHCCHLCMLAFVAHFVGLPSATAFPPGPLAMAPALLSIWWGSGRRTLYADVPWVLHTQYTTSGRGRRCSVKTISLRQTSPSYLCGICSPSRHTYTLKVTHKKRKISTPVASTRRLLLRLLIASCRGNNPPVMCDRGPRMIGYTGRLVGINSARIHQTASPHKRDAQKQY